MEENQEITQQNQQPVNNQTQQNLPNATGVLVLGILSIVFCCCCYGFFGLILSIIALILAGKSNKIYISSPELYTESSFKNLKAGKVCAIIGICLSGLFFIIGLLYVALYGTAALVGLSQIPWEEIMNQ